MSSLSKFPDELLLEVFRNVQSHRDVVSLALQNRRFHGLSDLTTRRKYRRIAVIPSRQDQALHALIDIVKKPRFGEYVRHIELDCHARYSGSPLSREEVQQSGLEMIDQAIKDAGFVEEPERRNVMWQLFPGNGCIRLGMPDDWHRELDNLTMLLVSVSPRLESLACCDLGYYDPKHSQPWNDELFDQELKDSGSNSPLGKFLDRVGRERNSPHLQHLRRVDFLPDSSMMRYDGRFYHKQDFYHCLNVIRRLPALESVTFEAAQDAENLMSIRPPPRCGNYSKIAFRHSTVSYDILSPIVESSRNLKEFTIAVDGRSIDSGGGLSVVSPDHLLKSLLVHRDTLEYLDVNLETHVLFNELLRDECRELFLNEVYGDAHGEEERQQKFCEAEWADEMSESTRLQERDAVDRTDGPALSLRTFNHLKYLGIGIYTLFYLAQGIGEDRLGEDSYSKVSLVDNLPPNLESLRIYGYEPDHQDPGLEGVDVPMDHLVSKMMEEIAVKIPCLKKVEGVDEKIPNAETVDDPGGKSELLWEREDLDWSDYEY